MKKFFYFFLLSLTVLTLIAFGGCQEGQTNETGNISQGSGQNSSGSTTASGLMFVIKTEKGDIKGEFYPNEAPNTVLNFVTLSKEGFYDGLTFHRVEPNFVIQGGDPAGDGSGGPGYSIPAEFNNHPHVPGALAMARSKDPDSAGCQFYIVLTREQAEHLDGQYTVFGQVTEGMDVVKSIEVGDKIEKIEITGELPKELQDKQIEKSNVE